LKIAHFDCFSGISGDMCLGALVDAGVSLKNLVRELKKIPVRGYEIHAKKVKRAGVAATKVDVIQKAKSKEQRAKSNNPPNPPLAKGGEGGFLAKGGKGGFEHGAKSEEQGAKRWKDIEKIIQNSSLSKEIKEKGLKIFERLFKAEAKVHGDVFDSVHLHELGAVDCLIDVFGTIIGLDILEVEKVYSSPVNLGSGSIKTAHGILPVPAPASAEILKGVPVYSTDSNYELTTPTGAALVKEFSSKFGSIPLMNIKTIGLGAGSKNFKDRPNVLRMFIGNTTKFLPTPLWKRGVMGDLKADIDRLFIGNPPIPPLLKRGFEKLGQGEMLKRDVGRLSDEQVTLIESNIDDMNPQIYEYVMERLFKAGALDVFLTQVLMKKGRPGVKLTVLCKETDSEELIKIIMKETTTIGLRFYDVKRRVLQREIKIVDTEFGKVRIKLSKFGDEILKATPEYEDCKRIAKKLKMPLIEVMEKIKITMVK
jgi:hypothetical protein